MALDPEGTILVLTGIGIPPYSARGLTQTLTPIPEATQFSRSINGTAMDLSFAQFRKYASKISCADVHASPAIDGIWPGALVTVECVCELAYPNTTDAAPQRDVVAGSERIVGDFVHYRPILDMMVVALSTSEDEWPAVISWEMDLVEV